MLILSRKQDDGVMIGDDIEIKIISIDKGSVRLGFKAPSSMLILRSELKDAIAMQNQQASINAPRELTLPKVGTIKKK
ncbi:carbon storage regulator [uncultured Helicobacter sp.]|uniref:carbon storage regulator n=1 Tax=uncultured Helicobacter sp. TaxID=175537 RepID=UPI001C3A158D|nr:carbon storage regulator [Candidatus Helicobacter avicola]